MDAKQFLAEFRHIASLPEGSKHLREIVLSLAFQGSLAEHAAKDAAGLLFSLQEQRENSHEATQRARKRSVTIRRTVQPPFTIPEHWRWLSLREIGHDWGQTTPSTHFTYIDVSSIDNQRGAIREPLTVFAPSQAPGRARKIVRRDTVIYSTVRPYLLNIALIDREFEHEPIASTAFAVIHPWEGVLPKYVYYYLRCPYFVTYVQSVQIGMAYPAISDEKFFGGLIPIPPTSEQKFIVAKVEELMALCDKLEAQKQEREALCKLTRKAALDNLVAAQSSKSLATGWERVRNGISLWLDNEDAVTELRNAVGFLGCRGLLTELTPTDSTKTDEALFSLPTGWSWMTLRQLSEYITSGSRGWGRFRAPWGDIFIQSQDIKSDSLVFEPILSTPSW
jgi:type I restriction enzyme S subunit